MEGYAAIVKAREERLFFASGIMDRPVFRTRQVAQD
jgi:hypothetical protein